MKNDKLPDYPRFDELIKFVVEENGNYYNYEISSDSRFWAELEEKFEYIEVIEMLKEFVEFNKIPVDTKELNKRIIKFANNKNIIAKDRFIMKKQVESFINDL